MSAGIEEYWITDRHLGPGDVQVHRRRTELRLERLINAMHGLGQPLLFCWSPPKCGMTTFLGQFRHRKSLSLPYVTADAFNVTPGEVAGWEPSIIEIEESEYSTRDDVAAHAAAIGKLATEFHQHGHVLLVQGRLDLFNALSAMKRDLTRMGFSRYPGRIDSFKQAVQKLDNRKIGKVCIAEFALIRDLGGRESPCPTANNVFKELVAPSLRHSGQTADREAVNGLVGAVNSNLFLVQALMSDACRVAKDIGKTDVTEQLNRTIEQVRSNPKGGSTPACVKQYFEGLAKEAFDSERSAHRIVGYLEREGGFEERTVIHGLNFINTEQSGFESDFLHAQFKVRFSSREVIAHYEKTDKWMEVLPFYHLEIGRLEIGKRLDVVKRAFEASIRAKDIEAFGVFGREVTRLTPHSDKHTWIEDDFYQSLKRLVSEFNSDDLEAIAFEILRQAVGVITLTERGRIYAVDLPQKRLTCRKSWGTHADVWMRETVEVINLEWKVVQVFLDRDQKVSFVGRTQEDPACNTKLARRLNLTSCWLFPLSAPDADENFGVLCVDNPVNAPLGNDEKEIAAIEKVVAYLSRHLLSAKQKSDRTDLAYLAAQALTLHDNALADKTDVFKALSTAIRNVLPSVDAIVCHTVVGYGNRKRLLTWHADPQDYKHSDIGPCSDTTDLGPEFISNVPRFLANENSVSTSVTKQLLQELLDRDLEIGSFKRLQLQAFPDSESKTRLIGLCDIFTKESRQFSETEHESLTALVRHASFAIEKRARQQNHQEYVEGVQTLHGTLQQVFDDQVEVSEIINEITSRLRNIFDADLAAYLSIDRTRERLLFENDPLLKTEMKERFPEGFVSFDRGVSGWAVSTDQNKVCFHDDPEFKALNVPLLNSSKTCAAVLVRDYETSESVGVFTLETKAEYRFSTESEIELISSIISHIPAAVRLARVFSELSDKQKEVTQTLHLAEVGEAVGKLSHALEPTLTLLLALIERVDRQFDGIPTVSSKTKQLAGNVHQHVRTAIGLVSELKDAFADIEKANKVPTDIRELNIEQLVSRTATKFSETYKDTEISPALPASIRITSSEENVEMIIHLLIQNACEAATDEYAKEASPKVTITMEAPKDRELQWAFSPSESSDSVLLRISNNGAKVPQEKKSKLFSGIVQSEKHRRTGMGLLLACMYARRINANIAYDPNDANTTDFYVHLPSKFSN